mmetsp:Transcript_13378/g.35558  ORF Transcript_13378/g.35558 Transcript_13378/m.35558 type:complete len:678 (+) Transcript_13378:163-2196(+)
MASPQTLEALAAWARTFDGNEDSTITTLSKDLATAFTIIGDAPCTPHNLLRRLKRWYAQELSRDVSSLIDEASDDVVKQASLVLGAAVQGSQREEHITTIMSLDDTIQAELMILVQSIMNTTAQAPSCTQDDLHEEDRRASMQEIARLKDEKSQLSEKNNEALEKERRKSELSLQARDEALQAKASAEKALEKVRSTLRACELREERCQREKLELTKKCERYEAALSSSSDAHKTLSDELDVARSRARDADQAEARVAKLKKKLDDVASHQRELQELDEANSRHVQEITRLEVLLSSREKRDADVDQLRVEKTALDQRVFDLNKACEDKDEELRRITLQKEESDAQRRFFEDELNSARPVPQSPEQMAPVFEESASELRDRLRDAQRNVARLEAENEARFESEAAEVAALRDRIADLEFEKAQLESRPPPPPSPSLDATQRMHALALKDATIADLKKRLESNSDLEELKRRYDEASKAAIRDREAQDATIVDLEKRLASVATERDQIIGDLQRHLAEESTNTLNAVAAQDATIADLRRRLANNTSEGIAERDSIIADLRERIARNASSPAVEDALGDLRQRVAEAQQQTAAELAERDATIAKLTSDREKLETYTKKTLGNVQEKYSVLVQTYKNQIRDKQERISRLEGELERHRRELASSREFSAVTPNGGSGETCV